MGQEREQPQRAPGARPPPEGHPIPGSAGGMMTKLRAMVGRVTALGHESSGLSTWRAQSSIRGGNRPCRSPCRSIAVYSGRGRLLGPLQKGSHRITRNSNHAPDGNSGQLPAVNQTVYGPEIAPQEHCYLWGLVDGQIPRRLLLRLSINCFPWPSS